MSKAFLLIEELRAQGVMLSTKDGNILVNAPKGSLSTYQRSMLTAYKLELLALLVGEAEYELLRQKIEDMTDLAANFEVMGNYPEWKRLLAEQKAVIAGPYHDSRRRYMALVGDSAAEFAAEVARRLEREVVSVGS